MAHPHQRTIDEAMQSTFTPAGMGKTYLGEARGAMRSNPAISDATQAVRRFTEAPYRQTGPLGMAADALVGGTARYADKLFKGEQMDTAIPAELVKSDRSRADINEAPAGVFEHSLLGASLVKPLAISEGLGVNQESKMTERLP